MVMQESCFCEKTKHFVEVFFDLYFLMFLVEKNQDCYTEDSLQTVQFCIIEAMTPAYWVGTGDIRSFQDGENTLTSTYVLKCYTSS